MLKCEANVKRKEVKFFIWCVFFQAARGNLNFRSKNSKQGDKGKNKGLKLNRSKKWDFHFNKKF